MKQMFRKISSISLSTALRALAYAIPVLALLIVLYLNYLPFGYDKTFVIQVGVAGDKSGQFALQDYGGGLSPRMNVASGTPHRTLYGSTYATYSPTAYLRNATATIDIDVPGLIVIPPNISFNPDSIDWDYSLPRATSSACIALDGAGQKPLTGTGDLFPASGGAFSVFASWTPASGADGFQQIVGHGNWELLQNKDDVKFQIGSTSIKQAIDDETFFGKPHTALGIYQPATALEPNGHMDLFMDNTFSGRIYFQRDANLVPLPGQDLTLGKSSDLEASFFTGCIADVRVRTEAIDAVQGQKTFAITRGTKHYPITLIAIDHLVTLTNISLHVVQK